MSRDIHELERWIEQHPRLAMLNTVGLAIFLGELALLVSYLLKWGVDCVSSFGS